MPTILKAFASPKLTFSSGLKNLMFKSNLMPALFAKEYKAAEEDNCKMVIASTASPYKFARSVMTSIDEKYDALEEFDLIDELAKVSCVEIPNAIEEIRNAEILHTRECDSDKMKETVKSILNI